MEKPRLQLALGRRKKLEQDLEHITQEMYRRNLELVRANKTLSLLRQIDSLVLESQDGIAQLCQQISESIAASYEYPFVGIFISHAHSDQLKLLGWSANDKTVLLADTSLTEAYLDSNDPWYKSAKGTQCTLISDMSTKQLARQLHCAEKDIELMRERLSLGSICIIKLMARQHLVGAMAVGFNDQIEQLSHNDNDFLERLSGAVGVAVDNKLLFEENQHIVGQLQKTNARLRLLDETKDDFISMASHQLRTPLTSVKGYLSMVLEGDAGKVSDKQSKLLNQAFLSSQRMVYLIADLLNVSRLKTGKFVIQPALTNLADVVEQEISQLIETATARGLEITYKKPPHFPTVMLDETKIRQVIMNFIDNAIYYTPKSGHIKVALEETEHSIKFEVADNGIGVPRSEQHHLFSKFYRAPNARKARPDGTGLGLFMAKKVIIAQGGSIIFHSEEGKGSTFGFSFAKSKVMPIKTSPVVE